MVIKCGHYCQSHLQLTLVCITIGTAILTVLSIHCSYQVDRERRGISACDFVSIVRFKLSWQRGESIICRVILMSYYKPAKKHRQQAPGMYGHPLGTRNCAERLVARWPHIRQILPTEYGMDNRAQRSIPTSQEHHFRAVTGVEKAHLSIGPLTCQTKIVSLSI